MTDTARGFDEIEAGASLPTRVIEAVRENDIWITALLLRDPNPIHFDLDAVSRAGLGNRAINQGGATMAYVIDFVTSWAGRRVALRSIDCSFRGNVAAGDDVEIGATVTGVERTATELAVTLEVWADVVGGRRAITGRATVVVPTDSA